MKRYLSREIIKILKDDGISISFPDLPGCLPCADTVEEAVKTAKEAMMLHLFGMEEDNEEIPEPTPISEIVPEKIRRLSLLMPLCLRSERNSIPNLSKRPFPFPPGSTQKQSTAE